MNRIDFVELLQSLFPDFKIYNVGQHYKHSLEPYFVVRASTQLQEYLGSRLGAYQIFDIMVYVPETSIVILDNIIEDIHERLIRSAPYKRYFTFTGTVSQDYHDTDIQMYTRSVTVQVPRSWGK